MTVWYVAGIAFPPYNHMIHIQYVLNVLRTKTVLQVFNYPIAQQYHSWCKIWLYRCII